MHALSISIHRGFFVLFDLKPKNKQGYLLEGMVCENHFHNQRITILAQLIRTS